MSVPFVAIGADELGDPTEIAQCAVCGAEHPIEYGTSRTLLPGGTSWSEPTPSRLLGFYSCDGKTFLATIDGRRWK